MSLHAVVLVKSLALGKSRLDGVLTSAARHQLIATMLADVISALASASVDEISVLTQDATLVPQGCGLIHDPGFGLNAAVTYAAQVVAASRARTMLVLPGDLPFATPGDIRSLIDARARGAVVIAPDAADSGTNALLLTPPTLLRPQFGPRSFVAHAAAARTIGASVAVVRCPGLACDIDEPGDLETLLRNCAQRYAFLAHAARKAS